MMTVPKQWPVCCTGPFWFRDFYIEYSTILQITELKDLVDSGCTTETRWDISDIWIITTDNWIISTDEKLHKHKLTIFYRVWWDPSNKNEKSIDQIEFNWDEDNSQYIQLNSFLFNTNISNVFIFYNVYQQYT